MEAKMHAADITMRMGYPVTNRHKTKQKTKNKTPGMRGTFHVLHLENKK
jgi:hypothetical protein